jgi:DNA repair exonuclease SbcCD ATPase subunit
MKIIKLSISDVGGVEAVELEPNGEHVILGGPNAAGKSTVLNAIAGALGGGRNRKPEKVRRGAKRGEVVVDLGDLVVRWRTNADGRDTLEVASADGATYKSPQAMLDKLWGDRTFDPLAWFRAEPRAQAAMLAELAGVDLDEMERRRRAAFDERTAVNRLGRELEAQAADPSYSVPEGTPDEPVDEEELATAVHDAAKTNAANAERRAELKRLKGLLETHRAGVETVRTMGENAIREARERGDARVNEAEEALRRAKDAFEAAKRRVAEDVADAKVKAVALIEKTTAQVEDLERQVVDSTAAVAALSDIDVAAVNAQLEAARQTNRAVERRQARTAIEARAETQRQKAAALTSEIEAVDAEKAEAIAAAALPIDGLGLEDGAVTWHGRRLELLSSSEQLRVSVALGLARHPRIAVMLIDRWGDLDDDSRRLVREMADAAGCQIWTTVVGERDQDITVTIREGRVDGPERPLDFSEFDD